MDKNYELVFVLAPDLKDEQLSAVKNKIVEDLTGIGAVIKHDETWGKRDLAFEVKDFRQGWYFLLNFTAPSKLPGKLKERFKVNEKIIRYLLTEWQPHVVTPLPDKKAKQTTTQPPAAKAPEPPAAKAPEPPIEAEIPAAPENREPETE